MITHKDRWPSCFKLLFEGWFSEKIIHCGWVLVHERVGVREETFLGVFMCCVCVCVRER